MCFIVSDDEMAKNMSLVLNVCRPSLCNLLIIFFFGVCKLDNEKVYHRQTRTIHLGISSY